MLVSRAQRGDIILFKKVFNDIARVILSSYMPGMVVTSYVHDVESTQTGSCLPS